MEIKRSWELQQPGFERLLQKLSPNRDLAALEYERLRFRLTKLFQWKGRTDAEDLADRTLDRLARRLEDGEQIDPVYSYCCGIARMLLLEAHREKERQSGAIEQLVSTQSSDTSRDSLPLDVLLQCLRKLPDDTRAMVLEYYQGDKRLLIDQRKALAHRLGIPINALRLRINRVRIQLERCVSQTTVKGK
jgi:DNA-directed RNA polymerase specialized sigma24 family protein